MHEMEQGGIAGLTTAEKHKQTVFVYQTLLNILRHDGSKACHGKYHLLMYKGKHYGNFVCVCACTCVC